MIRPNFGVGPGALVDGPDPIRCAEPGGEGGIRTPGTLAGTRDFQSRTFDHSVTSPEARPEVFSTSGGWRRGKEGSRHGEGQPQIWEAAREAPLGAAEGAAPPFSHGGPRGTCPRRVFRDEIEAVTRPVSAPMPKPEPKSSAASGRGCRVWITEDHLSIRQLLESFITLQSGFTVAGSSPDAAPALGAARAGEVDIVILDLMLRGDGGIAALVKLRELARPPRVLIYSATSTAHSLQLALTHGAAGYVEKSDSLEELSLALGRLRDGGMHFSAGPSRLLATLLRPEKRGRRRGENIELKVLEKLARGAAIKAAAHELGLSVQKVYRVRQTLMERANAHTPQDLTRYAIEMGLVGAHRTDIG